MKDHSQLQSQDNAGGYILPLPSVAIIAFVGKDVCDAGHKLRDCWLMVGEKSP